MSDSASIAGRMSDAELDSPVTEEERAALAHIADGFVSVVPMLTDLADRLRQAKTLREAAAILDEFRDGINGAVDAAFGR